LIAAARVMWRPNNSQWWVLVMVAVFITAAWPPATDKSLATKFVNWAVDPANDLPVLPSQLPLGLGDDPDAVAAHDIETQRYDALYLKGGWTRRRLQLKVAGDPLNPVTQRQLLAVLGVAAGFVAWRLGRTL
jgi:hypothetical protein